MLIPVGPHTYEVRLVEGWCRHPDGRRCLGLTWPEEQRIEIASAAPASKRLATLWHEIAHAWHQELDVRGGVELDGEAMANIVGMAMAAMSVKIIARLHCYMTTGRDCDDVMLISGLAHPLPVISLDSPGRPGPA